MTRFQNVGLKNQDEMNVQRSQLVGGGGRLDPTTQCMAISTFIAIFNRIYIYIYIFPSSIILIISHVYYMV